MKHIKTLQFGWLTGGLALACALLTTATTTRANVYATDIKIDGTLSAGTVNASLNGNVGISYILNEAATGGVTVNIYSQPGNTLACTFPIASPNAGTLRGLNTIAWGATNTDGSSAAAGNYSVSITAVGAVYTVWTQTSVDANTGNAAYYPQGIAVDNNITSQYYGRVVMSCALNGGTATTVPVAAQRCGIYKMNADGSEADEGWYGNANYLTSDAGQTSVGGNMANDGGDVPRCLRVGDDDRIYWVDSTKVATVLSCDMLATQFQVVLAGPGGTYDTSPYNYLTSPDLGDYIAGFHNIDVAFLTSVNANTPPILLIGDNDFPNAGIWMYHLVNNGNNAGNTVNNVLVSDPADTAGTQVVYAGSGSDVSIVASGGVMIDDNLDIFCGQSRNNENAAYDAMMYPDWPNAVGSTAGVVPPEAGSFNYALTTQITWGYGSGLNATSTTDASFEAVEDCVINSRANPTVLACPMGEGSQFKSGTTGGGIRLLNAMTGALVTAGSTTYSNLDNGQAYTCAAWDSVGNLYAASTTRNRWRVYSPPNASANTYTTPAVETVNLTPLAPTVTINATAFSAAADSNAVVSATFYGSSITSVQWYQVDPVSGTTALPGADFTTAGVVTTLTLPAVQDSQNGDTYYVIVTSSVPSAGTTVQSASATLTVVNPTATFTTTTFAGAADSNAAPITVTYNGNSQTVVWHQVDTLNNDTLVPSGDFTVTATSSVLTLPAVQDSQNNDKYYAVISWPYAPSITTSTATLTVNNPTVTFTTTTFAGDANSSAAAITATFNGNNQTVVWHQVDSGNNDTLVPSGEFTVTGLPSGVSSTLTLTGLTPSQNGDKYYAVVSWPYAPSVTTSKATLTVYNNPAIQTQIANLLEYVPVGYVDTLSVSAVGATPISYQWYEDGNPINLATSSSYAYTAVAGTHTFYVNVYNSVQPAGINSSTATVIAPSTALSFSSTTGANSAVGWDLNGGATFVSAGVLQLTTAATSQARSAFYALGQLPINGFVATFTYTPSAGTASRADGFTFCLSGSSTGPTKVGGSGGSLGVSGITPSAELEFNLYSSYTTGIRYATGGSTVSTATGYTATTPVNINSGDPINVTIVYNDQAGSMYVSLFDPTAGTSYSTTYSGNASNSITGVLGSTTAWVGFTGATGGSDAVQQVKNFLFQNIANAAITPGAVAGGSLPLTWNVGAFSLQNSSSVQGPWTPVTGITIVTNFVSGQASTSVPASNPQEFYQLFLP